MTNSASVDLARRCLVSSYEITTLAFCPSFFFSSLFWGIWVFLNIEFAGTYVEFGKEQSLMCREVSDYGFLTYLLHYRLVERVFFHTLNYFVRKYFKPLLCTTHLPCRFLGIAEDGQCNCTAAGSLTTLALRFNRHRVICALYVTWECHIHNGR